VSTAEKDRKRQRRIAKWPTGWEEEAHRLAELYAQTARDSIEYETDRKAIKAVIAQLSSLHKKASAFTECFETAVNGENQKAIINAFLARESRLYGSTEKTSQKRMHAFIAEAQQAADHLDTLTRDFLLAAKKLQDGWKPKIGNQSTLAMRFLIHAAALSYINIFKDEPGRSRGDPGTFGHFLAEIIALVPAQWHPQKGPSPSAIQNGLAVRHRRRPDAKSSGT
jgi:hypothetical protein